MTTVLASTEDVPELGRALRRRQELGQDLYDEVWERVYRIVPAPGPRHAAVQASILALLELLADEAGLVALGPVNVGTLDDYRVPDMCVVQPADIGDGAFLATAEVVVEILSATETAGVKRSFYAGRAVAEYMEIRLDPIGVELRRLDAAAGHPVATRSLALKELDLTLVAERVAHALGEH